MINLVFITCGKSNKNCGRINDKNSKLTFLEKD